MKTKTTALLLLSFVMVGRGQDSTSVDCDNTSKEFTISYNIIAPAIRLMHQETNVSPREKLQLSGRLTENIDWQVAGVFNRRIYPVA